MANEGRDAEIEMLKEIDGIDITKISDQISGKKTEVIDPPKVDPPKTDPPKADPPKNVPDRSAIESAILSEMFGEQYRTVDDVKKANIPASLQELVTLRQKTHDLETQLKAKPKHNFASDDIAKFNEFSRETGLKNFEIFNQLSAVTDIANMTPIDALVLNHIVENPEFASTPARVRKYFETKYNVEGAKEKIEAGELTQDELDNRMMDMAIAAKTAKTRLGELKGKIKMPEIPAEDNTGGPKKWTPEIEKTQRESWTKVNEVMGKELSTISIPMKDSKEPIINFVVPEEAQKAIMKDAVEYAVSNQLEVTQENLQPIAIFMRDRYIMNNLGLITHSIFEKARTMTEKEYLEKYNNPSKEKNNDKPGAGAEPESDEAKKEKAFQSELKR